MNLEADDGTFRNLLDGARGPHAIVAAGRICCKKIIDLVVSPELIGNLSRIVINRLVGFHPNQQAITVERRSSQSHVHREVSLLLIHVRKAGRAARYRERDYVMNDLSVAGPRLGHLDILVFGEVGGYVEILVLVRSGRIKSG